MAPKRPLNRVLHEGAGELSAPCCMSQQNKYLYRRPYRAGRWKQKGFWHQSALHHFSMLRNFFALLALGEEGALRGGGGHVECRCLRVTAAQAASHAAAQGEAHHEEGQAQPTRDLLSKEALQGAIAEGGFLCWRASIETHRGFRQRPKVVLRRRAQATGQHAGGRHFSGERLLG